VAVIAFALGPFQDFGPSPVQGEPRVDWVDGVAIMVAVFIVVSILPLMYDPATFTQISVGLSWVH
jgi:hypothetical protein